MKFGIRIKIVIFVIYKQVRIREPISDVAQKGVLLMNQELLLFFILMNNWLYKSKMN